MPHLKHVPVFALCLMSVATGRTGLAHDLRQTGPAAAITCLPAAPGADDHGPLPSPWPVATSLKTTLAVWAAREGWPPPQFLTDADWLVAVPGVLPGSIEDALEALVAGFKTSNPRPSIEISGNHVMLVSEVGAE